MPTDSDTTWGTNIANAIKALNVQAGTPVTDAQLQQLWAAVKAEDKTQLGKADVAPGSFSNGGGPVGGVGGPVT